MPPLPPIRIKRAQPWLYGLFGPDALYAAKAMPLEVVSVDATTRPRFSA